MWIGYQKENGNWVNTDMEPMSYNNWHTALGQPDNWGNNENCIEVRDLGNTNPWAEDGVQIGEGALPFVPGWNDQRCDTENQYICQKVVNSMTTTSTTTSTTTTTTTGKSIIVYF